MNEVIELRKQVRQLAAALADQHITNRQLVSTPVNVVNDCSVNQTTINIKPVTNEQTVNESPEPLPESEDTINIKD